MRFIGRMESAPRALASEMRRAERLTAENTQLVLFIALNYGGRAEILDAARRFRGGGEEEFRGLLYAPDMHDPQVVIRTSGERRLSNFLLWQAANAEPVFRETSCGRTSRGRRSRKLCGQARRRIKDHRTQRLDPAATPAPAPQARARRGRRGLPGRGRPVCNCHRGGRGASSRAQAMPCSAWSPRPGFQRGK